MQPQHVPCDNEQIGVYFGFEGRVEPIFLLECSFVHGLLFGGAAVKECVANDISAVAVPDECLRLRIALLSCAASSHKDRNLFHHNEKSEYDVGQHTEELQYNGTIFKSSVRHTCLADAGAVRVR
jgi:hypothetical protein